MQDLLLHRPRIRTVENSSAPDNSIAYSLSFCSPKIRTKIFFSGEETQQMQSILEERLELPTDYLVICPNIPREFSGKKKLSIEDWLKFAKDYKKNKETVVLTPTHAAADYQGDKELEQALRAEGYKVHNLQDILVRDKSTLTELETMQPAFGIHRRHNNLNFRQDASLYKLLLQEPLQGLFQDSAPVHIAAAASELPVVSGSAFNDNYRPHNGGVIWRYMPKLGIVLKNIVDF